ncbi:MAG: hypothetical protein UC662_09615 [Paraprevotella clara]|nr:hypothetical protein [Paraprevotella clara]
MESENKILKPVKYVAICTKVENVNTLFALYGLVPENFLMQSFSEARALCEGGGVYLALFDGCLFAGASLTDVNAWHAPSACHMSVTVDNFIFAMLLRYAFEFTPNTSGHE